MCRVVGSGADAATGTVTALLLGATAVKLRHQASLRFVGMPDVDTADVATARI
jgi:hypothetical protein